MNEYDCSPVRQTVNILRVTEIEIVSGQENQHFPATAVLHAREDSAINRDWLLVAGSVLATTAGALLLVRWLAPQLLGVPADLQMVQTSKSVPPFFENVFREEDYSTEKLILHDPLTNIRFRPLLAEESGQGPHDILGFRNTSVPNTADVVVIGDSQTYGFGETHQGTWPSQLGQFINKSNPVIYNMAVGGWGAIQYLDMFAKAARLQPDVVVIAFYTGNDPLDAFTTAYGNRHWSSLRLNASLSKADTPKVGNMLDLNDAWDVTFNDGTRIIFTPKGRLAANDNRHPAIRAGYDIMAEVARRIGRMAAEKNVAVIFTVIPTRELAYARKVADEQLDPPETYRQLVAMEQDNIEQLQASIQSDGNAHYVDLIEALQTAALTEAALYPRQWDGHPGAAGYRVIAQTLAAGLTE